MVLVCNLHFLKPGNNCVIIILRNEISSTAFLHQKAPPMPVGGAFFSLMRLQRWSWRQLLQLSANRPTNDQLAKVPDPPKVER